MFNWKGLFHSHILERGWNYAYDGSVTGLVRTADSISAVVQGNEYYKVKIMYSGNKITDGYCSCPYAAKGEWCKHMAAVLYLADSGMTSDGSFTLSDQDSDTQSIKEIIESADRKEIEELLVYLANQDNLRESFIRSNLVKRTSSDIKQIEKEIDGVFSAYSDGAGFIDYHSAMAFERLRIIDSRNDIDKRCELLADENMQKELFDTIWDQNEKLILINKYGFALSEAYSEAILDFYSAFVSKLAEAACNRSRYDELSRYLMRMAQFSGGKERVRQLAWDWITLYPTRKVMVQMLEGLTLNLGSAPMMQE